MQSQLRKTSRKSLVSNSQNIKLSVLKEAGTCSKTVTNISLVMIIVIVQTVAKMAEIDSTYPMNANSIVVIMKGRLTDYILG